MRVGNNKRILVLAALLFASVACSLSAQPPGSPPDAVFADAEATASETSTQPVNTATSTASLTPEQAAPTQSETDVSATATPEPTVDLPTATSTPSSTMDPQPSATVAVLVETATSTLVPAPSPSSSPEAPLSTLDDAPLKQSDNFDGGGSFVTANIEGRYTIGYTAETFQFEVFIPEIDAWVIRSQSVSDVRQEIDVVS